MTEGDWKPEPVMVTVLTELSGARLGESDVNEGPESVVCQITAPSAEYEELAGVLDSFRAPSTQSRAGP